MVVLPDYQGLGIGLKMVNFIAELYKNERLFITLSNPALVNALKKDSKWVLIRKGHASKNKRITSLNRASSGKRITYSFRYIGDRK